MQITPGVETLTITGAAPGTHLTVLPADEAGAVTGAALITVVADAAGNAHVAFVPATHQVIADVDDLAAAVAAGLNLQAGWYVVQAGEADGASGPERGRRSDDELSAPVRVLGVDDHPDPSLYDQELSEGYGYLTVRDGVQLSVMVRFPDRNLYGDGPWPTVVEYSGYGPSNPDAPQPGTLIAGVLGFAVVGVNMRGSGCSGGVFDIFSPAQAADGYDVIETVARQPWALHNRVGMVGLSYPGISQLFVAATRPPSLAAITPLSVIDDLWRQQWPGGTYNSGFTRAWLAMRDAQTQAGGMAWDQARIDAGDAVCAANQQIRSLNLDFEAFGRAISDFRPAVAARRTADLVGHIDVPVYLTGAWQDEQTGSRFALMLEQFDRAPHVVFTLFNGHHPDGYSPMVIARWFEFLSFHVARRVPVVHPLVRQFAPPLFAEHFGYLADVEEDRFGDLVDDYDAALARYLAEPPVRILFESGAGGEVPGAPGARFEATAPSFPPPGTRAATWWLDGDGERGVLSDARPEVDGAFRYLDDPEAGEITYALTEVFDDFVRPTVPIDWTPFADGHCVRYETAPLERAVPVVGQGHVELWLRPGTVDTAVQVTLSEIRPGVGGSGPSGSGSGGDVEVRVQSGWHRPVHRQEDPERSDDVRVDFTFHPDHREPLVLGEWIRFRVPLMPVAHVFRPGTRLRLTVSTPGRDCPFWCFDNPTEAGAGHDVGHGPAHPSRLVLPVWDEVVPPPDLPPHDALRGQAHRHAPAVANLAADVGVG